MTRHYKTFGILGGGAWGTALAQMLAREGQSVLIWAREPEVAEAINARRENTMFLPGIALKPQISATNRLDELHHRDALFSVTPAQHARRILCALKPHLRPATPLVLCSKGIELDSGKFMTEVLAEELPDALPMVLSGPSFAADVARGLPTAVTLATRDTAAGHELIQAISTPAFRPYLGSDLIGTEIGGAVKNVLAIACGIALGKELGRSAHAALIARGYAEMTRLALAFGAEAETLTGLSGLGDLVLTCSSDTSRNMSLGLALGRGETLAAVLGARQSVTEGVATAPVLARIAREKQVDMPICTAVAAVIAGEISVDHAIAALMSRPVTAETAPSQS
jgi:glycerol-3-phosphate dehydrogenase (NAD(P)+)